MNVYQVLARLFPTRKFDMIPRRIVLIQPCCIGDVVMATATLKALRRAYPQAQITWAVGTWSRSAIANHELLDDLLDTGQAALPVKSPGALLHFAAQLKQGKYDLAVSLVRSPLMSLAVWLSGIPYRVGLDSLGRGFGYNLRAPIDPTQSRHEADIYLDVVRILGADTSDCYVNVPVSWQAVERVQTELGFLAGKRYLVINPAGGNNPGMMMDAKRWLPQNFAVLADRLAAYFEAEIVIVAGPNDTPIVQAVRQHLQSPALELIGKLTFPEIAALAHQALVYIGNDTGLTHLAAATGAKTVMILGPSDPMRYAPYAPNGIAVWKPVTLQLGGVASGIPVDWDWQRDGVGVNEVYAKTVEFIG